MKVTAGRVVEVLNLGRMAYGRAHEIQQERLGAVAGGEAPDTLILCEHEPVITLGRGAKGRKGGHSTFPATGPTGPLESSTGKVECPLFVVERGGAATYHGPGQLVGYPILRLAEGERDLHRYLRNLEEVLILALADLGLAAGRRPGWTGVWAGGFKLASIGVAVRRWTTWHGFALNCDVDLTPCLGFRPCGLDGEVYTTASRALGRPVTVQDATGPVVERFGEVFGRDIVRTGAQVSASTKGSAWTST